MRSALRPLWILASGICVLTLAACDENGPNGVRAVFGSTGLGPGEFSYPRAAALRADGRLYVVDKAARIQCFDLNGEFSHAWRMPEWSAGKPTGLGVGPDGRVYIADTHYSRVIVCTPEGDEVERFGAMGTGRGQFMLPTDVAVDAEGFVYVGEYAGHDRISKFTPELEFVMSFGDRTAGAAALQRPQCLVFADDGTLWVADACNHRICQFSPEGALLSAFGREGRGPGELLFPYGMDWLSDGTLVICEYGNNRLQRFTRDGASLGTWGGPGRAAGELAYPWAVVTGPDDLLFVVDSGNNRIQVVDAAAPGVWRQP